MSVVIIFLKLSGCFVSGGYWCYDLLHPHSTLTPAQHKRRRAIGGMFAIGFVCSILFSDADRNMLWDYFFPKATAEIPTLVADTSKLIAEEKAYLELALKMNTKEALEDYSAKYPNGNFKDLAEDAWAKLVDGDASVPPKPAEDAAAPAPVAENEQPKEWTEPITGMEFVWIEKPGCFQMGSPENEPERGSDEKQHEVCIDKGYYLGKYEVTQAQWKTLMEKNPSSFQGDNLPVESISLIAKESGEQDIQMFINRLNMKSKGYKFSLPTEAQWEYAARAGTTTPFYTGNCITTDQANFNGNYEYNGCGAKSGVYKEKTAVVGSYAGNKFRLHDMVGNVWEWTCSDYVENYDGSENICSSKNNANMPRVIRGGSWDYDPYRLRSAARGFYTPGYRFNYLGFRLSRM